MSNMNVLEQALSLQAISLYLTHAMVFLAALAAGLELPCSCGLQLLSKGCFPFSRNGSSPGFCFAKQNKLLKAGNLEGMGFGNGG